MQPSGVPAMQSVQVHQPAMHSMQVTGGPSTIVYPHGGVHFPGKNLQSHVHGPRGAGSFHASYTPHGHTMHNVYGHHAMPAPAQWGHAATMPNLYAGGAQHGYVQMPTLVGGHYVHGMPHRASSASAHQWGHGAYGHGQVCCVFPLGCNMAPRWATKTYLQEDFLRLMLFVGSLFRFAAVCMFICVCTD